jgi:hypothetical protein
MFKASTAPKIVKQFVKPKDNTALDHKIRFFKTHNNRINFINNPNLDPKIRFHNVVKARPGFLVGGSRALTSVQGSRATLERLVRERSSRNAETGRGSPEAEERLPSQDQTQTQTQTPTSQQPEPELTSSYPAKNSALRSVADAFEARKKREQPARNFSSTTTANMSSELTKVLAKEACPRKSSDHAVYPSCLFCDPLKLIQYKPPISASCPDKLSSAPFHRTPLHSNTFLLLHHVIS